MAKTEVTSGLYAFCAAREQMGTAALTPENAVSSFECELKRALKLQN